MGKNKKSQQPQPTSRQKIKTQIKPISPPQARSIKQQKSIPVPAPAPVSIQQPANPMKFQTSTAKPYQVLNYTFCSRKVFLQFMFFSSLIVLLPIFIVYSTYSYVKDDSSYSELTKIVLSVGPSLFLINLFIAIYIYKVIKDPQNYTKEQPFKHVIPVGFKEQNMDRRRFVNQTKRDNKQISSAPLTSAQKQDKTSRQQENKKEQKPEQQKQQPKKKEQKQQNKKQNESKQDQNNAKQTSNKKEDNKKANQKAKKPKHQ